MRIAERIIAKELPATCLRNAPSQFAGAARVTTLHIIQIEKKGQTDLLPFFALLKTRILPAVTPAAPVSSTSSTTITPFHWLSFIDHEGAPVQVSAVKGLDGSLGLSPGTHVHEPETP